LQVYGTFTTGTVSATTATVPLPVGFSLDTTKLNANPEVYGYWIRSNSTANTRKAGKIVAYNGNASNLYFTSDDYTAAESPFAGTNASTIWSSTETQSVKFGDIPILGWSSSVQMSDQTDTRVVAARAYKNTAQSIATGAFTEVTGYSGTTVDTHGGFNSTTGRYTVEVAGVYRVTAQIFYENNATGHRGGEIWKNGAAATYIPLVATVTSGDGAAVIGYYVDTFKVGDTISMAGYQSSGGALNIRALAGGTNLSIERISGPSAIAASESVNAFYNGSASGTLAASWNTAILATKIKDSHGMYNTSTGVTTIQTSGNYAISAAFVVSATYALGQIVGTALYVDGALVSDPFYYTSGATTYEKHEINIVSYPLLAGQTVEIKLYNGGSTPTFYNGSKSNYFSLTRTGNY
jgi:hypothetical protein